MFDRFPDSLIATSVRSVDYILLEDVKESAFSEINKLVMKNGNIYIGDFRNHKIVVFDLAGNFKFAIDRKGRGPQEYLEIKNFAVDDHSIYVIDNYRHILYVYDSRSGKYLNKKKLPVVVWDVECFDNGDFLFAFAPPLPGGSLSDKQSPHRLFCYGFQLPHKTQVVYLFRGRSNRQANLFFDNGRSHCFSFVRFRCFHCLFKK